MALAIPVHSKDTQFPHLQAFLGLSDAEFAQFQLYLEQNSNSALPPVKATCLDPTACAKKAFQNQFWSFHRTKVLPVGKFWKPPSYALERRYINYFLRKAAVMVKPGSRCLEWGLAYIQSFMNTTCTIQDEIVYRESKQAPTKLPKGQTVYGDLHNLTGVVDNATYDVVVCTQVFEHLHSPLVAASELFRITKPGGLVFVTAPHLCPFHGSPADFYRYTHIGIRQVLTTAGFDVVAIEKAGNVMTSVAVFEGFATVELTPADTVVEPDELYLMVTAVVRRPL